MAEKTQGRSWTRCGGTTPRDRRNQLRVLWTMAVWAVCFVAGSLLIEREVLPVGAGRWTVAALPCLAAVLVLVAYPRFLREADELQRLVQLEALALGFGGAFFAFMGYPLFERLGAPTLDVGDLGVVMAILYSLGGLLGWRRYR